MKTEPARVPAQVAELGCAAPGPIEGALLQSTHAWVQNLPEKLRLFIDRLYSAWVVQHYARHYAHREPWDLPLPDEAAAAILQFQQGELVLAHSCFAPFRLVDSNVRVRVRREEARQKSLIDDSDLEPCAVGISEFGRHRDLSGSFGSLACRTLEGGGRWIDGR